MRKLEKDYPYSFTFIQKLIQSHEYDDNIKTNYPTIDGMYMCAVCKLTAKEFNDYKNNSGAITEHVFKYYPHEKSKSKYVRKSKEYATGKFWYDEYFTFVYRNVKEVKKCYYCDWTTEDILNHSGAYEKHLLSVHNLTLEEHVINNPDDITYFKNLTPSDAVTCAICGEKLKILNHKHLRKHNITLWEYKQKFGCDNIVSDTTKEKLFDIWNIHLKNQGFKKISNLENDLSIFLNSNGINTILSERNILHGKEIDIFCPNQNIGIEINGIYFHSEIRGGKNKDYHITKLNDCNSSGIKLIHIFEDELMLKKELTYEKILHILSVNHKEKIYARKCIIKEINKNNAFKFYEDHHIQGGVYSPINIGIFHNDTLMACMSFNNNRKMQTKYSDENTYELTRYATHRSFHILGGGGKALKYFIKNYAPKTIISFADRRWTLDINNNFYTRLGFSCESILRPDYTYVNGKYGRYCRLHKFGYGKNKIKKLFPDIYDSSKTEWEMMQEAGFDRIWDCGKFRYVLNLK